MKYIINQLVGADDNYVVVEVNHCNNPILVNVEQYLEEDEEIEKYFNINDVIEGTLALDTVKSSETTIEKPFFEQGIYKFSSYSKLNCKIISKISDNRFVAKAVNDMELLILAKKRDKFEIGQEYLVEGYFWLMQLE